MFVSPCMDGPIIGGALCQDTWSPSRFGWFVATFAHVCVCVCGRRAVWNKRMFWTNVSRNNGTFPSHNVFNGATAHVYVHKECFTCREGEREVRGDSQGKWERGRRGAFLETTNSAGDEGAFVVHVQYLLWAVSNSSCRCVHRARANARLNLEYVNVSRLWFVWVYIDRVVCVVCRLSKIKEWVDSRDPHALIIPFSAGLELKVCTRARIRKVTVQILSRFGTTLACTWTQRSILALTHISQQHLPASPVVPMAHVTNLWMFARPKLLNSLLIFGVYVCLHVNMCVCLHDSPHSCLTCQRMRRWGFVRRQRHRGKSITQCVQGVQRPTVKVGSFEE